MAAARKAMFAMRRRCEKIGIRDPALQCKLFHTLVLPILSHGIEVWGVEPSLGDRRRCTRSSLPSTLMQKKNRTGYKAYPTSTISPALSFCLEFAESFMADLNIFISLYTHLLKNFLLVLINVLTYVSPAKHQISIDYAVYRDHLARHRTQPSVNTKNRQQE